MQDELSLNNGKGCEHQFPQPYSHVGAGTVAEHFDAIEDLVEVIKVVDEMDVVVEDFTDVEVEVDVETGIELLLDVVVVVVVNELELTTAELEVVDVELLVVDVDVDM
ncbi:hypothetical protein MMC06_004546, partial [Schaereria dolodes]|nr:hypothetical protein [Schaereria dolodes]